MWRLGRITEHRCRRFVLLSKSFRALLCSSVFIFQIYCFFFRQQWQEDISYSLLFVSDQKVFKVNDDVFLSTTSTCEQSSTPAACSSGLALVCLHLGLRTGAGQWLSLKRNQGPRSPGHAVATSPPQSFSSNMAAMWDHVLDLQAYKRSLLFVTPRLLYESWCTENICWDIGVGLVES